MNSAGAPDDGVSSFREFENTWEKWLCGTGYFYRCISFWAKGGSARATLLLPGAAGQQ